MKKIIRATCDLLLGLLYLVSVTIGYYGHFSHMGEYCFLSSTIIGCTFIFSFLYGIIKKKQLPIWLYLDCVVVTMAILIPALTMGMNINGAFLFIHIINPILLICYWLFFCNHNELKNHLFILTCIIFPSCQMFLAFFLIKRFNIPSFPANFVVTGHNLLQIVLILIALDLALIVFGYLLHFLSCFLHKKDSSLLSV